VKKVLRIVSDKIFCEGDLVTIKSSRNDGPFCIIAFKINEYNQKIAVLKALYNNTYIIEKPVSDLNSFLIRGKL
jgi:hypothetical protein